jgi:putative phage-type endonuclease
MAQTREEWLAERKNGLGGSDMAALFGLSPWKSRYQLYMDKKGLTPDIEETEAMRMGKIMEPALRQFYSDTTGRAVRVPDKIIYHKEYPFIFANPDGLTDDLRVVELKTSKFQKGWGEPGSAEIPEYYALQCQHYMCVTGFKVCDVVVSIGGALPIMYELPADDELHELMVDEGKRFWDELQKGIEPTPISFSDAVSKFKLSSTVGIVYADAEIIATVEALRGVVEQVKELEAQDDALRAKIVVALGDNGDTLLDATGKTLVTWKMAAGRKTVDTKALEKEEPLIYAKYLKVGDPTRRFLLK